MFRKVYPLSLYLTLPNIIPDVLKIINILFKKRENMEDKIYALGQDRNLSRTCEKLKP